MLSYKTHLLCYIAHDMLFYITDDMLCYITDDMLVYIYQESDFIRSLIS